MKGCDEHLLVLAKEPVPGRVKTRLCPPYSPKEAAAIAAAALADTLETVAVCGIAKKILALDGEPGPWLPPGITVIRQRGQNFTERLTNAWLDADGPGVQIGMDTPQVRPDELEQAVEVATRTARSAVFGPARDGGWWLIGWSAADPKSVFRGIPLSRPRTAHHQLRRLHELGLHVTVIASHRDIDTIDDLRAVTTRYPRLRVAAVAS